MAQLSASTVFGKLKATGEIIASKVTTDELNSADIANASTDDVPVSNGDGTLTMGSIDNSTLTNSSVTIEGNSVSLGGSTSVNHNDLSSISSDDHHTKTTSASDLTDVSADSVSDAHHSKTTSASELTDVSADSVSDAHHTKTDPSDIDSTNWGDYEIQKNGTDGSGIINFKT